MRCASTARSGWGATPRRSSSRCPAARVIGLDRDEEALALSGERLARFGDRFVGVHAVYDDIATVLAEQAEGTALGILFDLGVSSLQLDEPERGFAYRHDAPLDMRMDQSHRHHRGRRAQHLHATATWPGSCKTYGEERFAGRIASAIVREREKEPFTSSARLVELLRDAVPAASQRSGGHPAKRTFQALRIEVNAELEVWERAVTAGDRRARPRRPDRGAVVPLARGPHHQAGLRRRGPQPHPARDCRSSCPSTPPTCACSPAAPRCPTQQEQHTNPRSASARLRAAERLIPNGATA